MSTVSSSSATDVAHDALTPVPAAERVFGFSDHAALWFSLGVGLLVMQVGAYLMPALSPQQALLAVLLGSVLGAGLLALVARIGCTLGLSSSALISRSLGRRFALLPVGLNVVQLLGWTAFELVVMRDGTAAIVKQLIGLEASWLTWAATLLWGGLLLALASGTMIGLVRRFVSRFGLPLVILSLLWLTWQFGSRLAAQGFDAWWTRPGAGGMSLLAGIDLVVAMPVSWLPLVADYARYGRSAGSALRGTWLGYAVANIWCYTLGILVVSTAPQGADLVSTLLLAQGGLLALGLILIDEADNAFGDVHSGAVSINFLRRGLSIRHAGLGLAVAATLAALALDMHGLEPFLLMLSSIFVPLFGVVISQLAGRSAAELPTERAVRWAPAAVWLLGIACFHAGAAWWPSLGSALPALALTLALGWVVRGR
ncbi:purine-cytosine permease family protein [Ideonella livida]|uniref:Allantoin permease n=1 Tax=Ideonella livida TaxID=2707176 RepID=A0A7C9THA5_9BURK|nr:cytosine permease [Ideonella livida]NDY90421.1 allantoin permease [Ideonella livida]